MMKHTIWLIFFMMFFSNKGKAISSNEHKQFLFYKAFSLAIHNAHRVGETQFYEVFRNANSKFQDHQTSNEFNLALTSFITQTCNPPRNSKSIFNNSELWIEDSIISKENQKTLCGLLNSKTIPHKLIYKKLPNKLLKNQLISKELISYGILKLWSELYWYYPYTNRFRIPWDSILLNMVIPVLNNSNSFKKDYLELIYKITNVLSDCHCSVSNGRQGSFMGSLGPLIIAQTIDGRTTIVESLEPQCPKGTIVISINGKDILFHKEVMQPYFSCSNYPSKDLLINRNVFIGNTNSINLTIEIPSGLRKEITLNRSYEGYRYSYNFYYPFNDFKKTNEIYKMSTGLKWKKINDSLGYTDLKYLKNKDVDEMFHHLGDCKTIIFDLRCYPLNTIDRIMLHLFQENSYYITFGKFNKHRLKKIDYKKSNVLYFGLLRYFFKPFKGKVIVLINEVCVSQSETMVLAFKALGERCTFIGGNTSGTNGNLTYLNLPLGIIVSYSGLAVFDSNKNCYQGSGIPPDIYVQNSLQDILHSQDAVLQKAIQISNK